MRRLWADPAWAGLVFYLIGRDARSLGALCAEAAAQGRTTRPWVLDLAAADAGLEAALGDLPPVKALLFAAGEAHDRALALSDSASFERSWSVNVGAHARLLKALHAPGRLAGDARGLLIGSLSGLRGRRGQTAYAAAKGSLVDLLPLAPRGLRLNVLLPPLLPSPFLDALSPQARAELFGGRLMDDPDPAASCADAAQFLLSDAASYVHRTVMNADSRVTALGWE